MSFLSMAVEALKTFRLSTRRSTAFDIVYHGYYDIGIAVAHRADWSSPFSRDATSWLCRLTGKAVREFGRKASDGSPSYEDLTAAHSPSPTAVYMGPCSPRLFSESAPKCHSRHAIIFSSGRSVNGEIVIRPMMYLLPSYDHRIIDGREAVPW